MEAVRWSRKAADQGHADAQHNLANMYRNGQGVAQSDVEAARWLCKAADQRMAQAQHKLANMYLNGQGVA